MTVFSWNSFIVAEDWQLDCFLGASYSIFLFASHNYRMIFSLLQGFHCVEVRISLSRNENMS